MQRWEDIERTVSAESVFLALAGGCYVSVMRRCARNQRP